MHGATGLRSLRERPFELLREMDRRARLAAQGQPESVATGPEWVGILAGGAEKKSRTASLPSRLGVGALLIPRLLLSRAASASGCRTVFSQAYHGAVRESAARFKIE